MTLVVEVLSNIAGFGYIASWGACKYPQFWTNYKLKHVKGYSPEYLLMNLSSFVFYWLYCVWGYIDPSKISGVVDFHDIIFASHAFILTFILMCQFLYYDKNFFGDFHAWVKIFLITSWTLSAIFGLLEAFGIFPNFIPGFNGCIWLGYVKVVITFLKYYPQALKNYRRKSTVGWNIYTTLFDIGGGTLSMTQIFIDLYRPESDGTINISKLLLGLLSVLFDLIFVIQHYILYRHAPEIKDPLLSSHKKDTNSVSDVSAQNLI